MKLYSPLFASVLLAASTDGEGGSTVTDNVENVTANTKSRFQELRKKFRSSITNAQKYARELANMCMEHFAAHGDLVYAQAFSDDCKAHANNFVRHVAFVEWMTTFSPCTYEKGKWTKDKDRAEKLDWPKVEIKIEDEETKKMIGYADVSFWDFAPERPIQKLDAEQVLAFIMGKVNSKKLAERVKDNADAEATLQKIKQALGTVTVVHVEQPQVETANAA